MSRMVSPRSIAAALIVTAIIACAVWRVTVRRHEENDARQFFAEPGAVRDSWIVATQKSWFDDLFGFKGFATDIVLGGDDPHIEKQLALLPKFRHLRVLTAGEIHIRPSWNQGPVFNDLRQLEISYCSGGFVSDMLAASPRLESLNIWESDSVSDKHLASASRCSVIKSIDINGASVSGSFASALRTSELRELTIAFCPIDSDGIKAISQVRSLRKLYLMAGSENVSLLPLANLQELKELTLLGFDDNKDEVSELEAELSSTEINYWP